MKQVLLAVQAELRNYLDYIRDRDIFIAPSVYSINTGAKMPCVAIKDGRPEMRELSCCAVEWKLPVHLVVFVQLAKDTDRAIIGDASTTQAGVLTIADDIKQKLVGNLLGMEPIIQAAILTDEMESEMFIDPQSNGIQRKQLTITYTKEVQGPCGS